MSNPKRLGRGLEALLGRPLNGPPETSLAIAEGILAAVKRLYLLGKNDRPTGTFTFAELLAHEQAVEQTRQAL